MIYEKDPDEVLDYQVDWTSYLADIGDIISTSSWQVPAGLDLNSADQDNTTATAWLSGGTAGEPLYKVTNHITTTGGRTVERSIYIRVLEH